MKVRETEKGTRGTRTCVEGDGMYEGGGGGLAEMGKWRRRRTRQGRKGKMSGDESKFQEAEQTTNKIYKDITGPE